MISFEEFAKAGLLAEALAQTTTAEGCARFIVHFGDWLSMMPMGQAHRIEFTFLQQVARAYIPR